MFRIHDAQMEFFNRRERSMYLARLQAYLERAYPECFDEMTSDEVREWVAEAVGICDKYGIKTEFAATQLVLLLLVLGPEPEQTYPWLVEIASDPDLYPERKVLGLVKKAQAAGIEGVDDVLLDAGWVSS